MNGPRLSEQDIKNAKNVSCEKCGCMYFKNVFLIKQISALISPNGQEINAPFPTFSCVKCDHVNKNFLPPDDRQTE